MLVYVLFIAVTFLSPDNVEHIQAKALVAFPTLKECEADLKELIPKMKDAYPGQTDYKLYCEARKVNPPAERLY